MEQLQDRHCIVPPSRAQLYTYPINYRSVHQLEAEAEKPVHHLPMSTSTPKSMAKALLDLSKLRLLRSTYRTNQ